MFMLGEISMKIDKLLISSAMLAAMCEKTGIDNLKMLEPFVLVCLANICEPRETIPTDKVLEMLNEQFALRSMPEAVLNKILSRIANGGTNIVREKRFTRDGHQFELVQKPMRQTRTFREQEEKAKRDTEDVVNALITWMQANTTTTLTVVEAKKYLVVSLRVMVLIFYLSPRNCEGQPYAIRMRLITK